MSWYEWDQSDLPCQFSKSEALAARDYLMDTFGREFIQSGETKRLDHPFLREWDTTGAGAFLQVNGLAQDVRLVRRKPGFDSVLADFRESRQCLPTWHLIHTAALFERAITGAFLEFIEPGGEERPDAIVSVGGTRIPLEAKLLTESEDEVRFHTFARLVERDASDALSLLTESTSVCIVLKRQPPTPGPVIAFLTEAIGRYRGVTLTERGEICNVFLQPVPTPIDIEAYRLFYVLAPVPDSEDLRVLGRAKKASNQLRSLSGALSGILAVGLSDHQNGAGVFAHIADRIQAGRLRGISGVLLVKRRTLLEPPQRMVLDLLEFRRNGSAKQPITSRVPLRPGGAAGLLSEVEAPVPGLRAYRFGSSSGRAKGPSASLFLPDIRVLSADDLQ